MVHDLTTRRAVDAPVAAPPHAIYAVQPRPVTTYWPEPVGSFGSPTHRRRTWRPGAFARDSVHAQPWFALLVFAMASMAGMAWLAAITPTWTVSAKIRLAEDPTAAINDMERGNVAATVAQLLSSSALAEEVVASHLQSSDTDGEVAAPVASSPTRPGVAGEREGLVTHADRTLRRWWMGLRPKVPGMLPARSDLHARASAIDGGTLIDLQISATEPGLAEGAPRLLLQAAQALLTRQERERLASRLAELDPGLAKAQTQHAVASHALTQYRLEIGQQDPEATATALQARLADIQSQRAERETSLAEAQAARLDIEARLSAAIAHDTGRIVTADNPRIQVLEAEISDLNSRLRQERVTKTDKHVDVARLQFALESKTQELNRQKRTTVREITEEPSPYYLDLLDRQVQNDILLTTLAGRELGLAEAEARLTEELAHATRQGERMAELRREEQAATARADALQRQADQLRDALQIANPFAFVELLDQRPLQDRSTADRPAVLWHLIATLAVAMALAIGACCLRASWTDRLVATWQVETLSPEAPVELLGEMPSGALIRRIARAA